MIKKNRSPPTQICFREDKITVTETKWFVNKLG